MAGVPATVHGVVRNAATGEPLPRALVRVEGDASTGALTDGEGRFELEGVPSGPQTIQLKKPGFHDRSYATEEIGNQSDGPAHSVLVTPGMPELTFALSPSSAIQGHIELSTGDPAGEITVILLKQVTRNGRALWAQSATTRTNAQGAYRFAGLSAGHYSVATLPALESEPAVTVVAATGAGSVERNGYPSVYFPEARGFAEAGRIRLTRGQDAEANLRLALEPFHPVTATAVLPGGRTFGGKESAQGIFGSFSIAKVLDAAGRPLPYSFGFDTESRTFQASLPDGAYTLLVGVVVDEPEARSGQSAARMKSRNQSLLVGYAEFSMEGHAVSGLRIPLAPLMQRPIHLRLNRTALATAQESAALSRGLQSLVSVTATAAGDPALDDSSIDETSEEAGQDLLSLNIPSLGARWISTQVNDRAFCVDSFAAGPVNVAREPLNLGLMTTSPPMEVVLRDDCARLELELPRALATFLPGDEPFYTVYVVPDFDTTVDIPPMSVHPSSGASLAMDGLTPGSYHVYTFNRPVRLEYRNPAALAALATPGQAVTLSPGASTELVLEVPSR